MSIDISAAKRAAFSDLQPGQPGREAILALPDELPDEEFDAILPSLIRLLRIGRSVGGGPLPANAGGDRRGGDAERGDDRGL